MTDDRPSASLPTVAVIIPVLNGADTIGEVLDDLAEQDYPDFTVYVVDNGSSDDTVAIAKGRGVVVLHEPIPGAAAARNRGLVETDSELVAFLDSDCTQSPDWLTAGVTALLDSEADLVGGQIDHRASHTLWAQYESLSYIRQRERISKQGVSATANLLLRRSVIDAIGPLEISLLSGEDDEFCLRARAAGLTLIYSPEAAVCRRASEGVLALWQRSVRAGRSSVRLRQLGVAGAGSGGTLWSRKRAYWQRVWSAPDITAGNRVGIILLNLLASVGEAYGRLYGARSA